MQKKTTKVDYALRLISILLATALLRTAVPYSYAANNQLINRYDKVSNSTPSASAINEVGFTFTNTVVPIGSFRLMFCDNDPLPNTPCSAPAGFSASGVVILDQSGETGFVVHPSSTANSIVFSRIATLPSGLPAVYHLGNIINPSSLGTYYIRLQTFASTDATGPSVEQGGIALSTARNFVIGTEVPPYLTVCVGVTITGMDCSTANSYFIDIGELNISKPKSASSQFVVETNAQFGYSVSVAGTTLTSGNNIIPALSAPASSSPGQPQFGLNLRANDNPAIGQEPTGLGLGTVSPNYNLVNKFLFNNGDIIASAPAPDYAKYTVSYIANINQAQPAGIYATTVAIIGLANF